MPAIFTEKTIRRIFNLSVILKGAHAALELIGGVAVLLVSPAVVMNIATALTADELAEDPKDFFANYLMHAAGQFSVSFQHLAAIYLIEHGLVIGFLVVGLLRRQLWSYPVSVAVLGLFIIYQSYQYAIGHSWWVLSVTLLDIAVILLTLHEYRYMKKAGLGRDTIEGYNNDR